MKCPKCSLQNAETQKFCGECGTSLLTDRELDVTRTTTINLPPLPLPPGSIFAQRYQIIEELGKGGMGRVIRALDQKLNEEIAIKFIRPDLTEDPMAVERFRTELKAARQVIHKNVARMFDLNEEDGIPYITMEYVKGGDLKSLIRKMGRLNSEQSVRIIKQVAEGLAEAHRTGVIHRDMKPHNIMVDEEGTARITDFGLARLRKSDDVTMTAPGMGTPAYASPEQVEGTEIDNRSDLYSLGIVLFEMLTGKLPFKGDNPYSVALARLTKAPPDPRTVQPDIPEALVQIIMKCLQKEREKRYQNAEELVGDLEGWEGEPSTWHLPGPKPEPGPIIWIWKWVKVHPIPAALLAAVILGILARFVIWPASPWKTSIAVLPIKELSPQEDSANLWYGFRSDVNSKLGTIQGLRVIPWSSIAEFDYSGKRFEDIGKQLGVNNLLDLNVQKAGTMLTVKADWIKVKRGSLIHHYVDSIDLADIDLLEDEIARETAGALHLKLAKDRLTLFKKKETMNPEVINYYWKGYRLIEEKYHAGYEPEYFNTAVKMYEKAIELDPNYALAYWGLGNAYEARYNNPYINKNPEDLERMKNYYLQAHTIAPDFAETNLGLGWMYFSLKDNNLASKHFRKAYDLEPDHFVVNFDVGAFLRSVGLYDKALKYLYRAVEIDPHSVDTWNQIFTCLLCLGKYRKAHIEAEEKVLLRDPDNSEARSQNAAALILMKKLAEAEKVIEITKKINQEKQMALAQALLYAARGEKKNALKLINGQNTLHVNIACIYIFLGMKEDAINTIEDGIEHAFEGLGHYLYPYPMLAKHPVFKLLRREPRFQELLRREKVKYEEEIEEFARF